MQLSDISTPDLRVLQEDVKKLIAEREAQEIQKARAQIIAIAQGAGIPLKELGKLGGTKKGNVPAKFRDPDDSSRTWTGRGRMPRWVQALENAGKLEAARLQ